MSNYSTLPNSSSSSVMEDGEILEAPSHPELSALPQSSTRPFPAYTNRALVFPSPFFPPHSNGRTFPNGAHIFHSIPPQQVSTWEWMQLPDHAPPQLDTLEHLHPSHSIASSPPPPPTSLPPPLLPHPQPHILRSTLSSPISHQPSPQGMPPHPISAQTLGQHIPRSNVVPSTYGISFACERSASAQPHASRIPQMLLTPHVQADHEAELHSVPYDPEANLPPPRPVSFSAPVPSVLSLAPHSENLPPFSTVYHPQMTDAVSADVEGNAVSGPESNGTPSSQRLQASVSFDYQDPSARRLTSRSPTGSASPCTSHASESGADSPNSSISTETDSESGSVYDVEDPIAGSMSQTSALPLVGALSSQSSSEDPGETVTTTEEKQPFMPSSTQCLPLLDMNDLSPVGVQNSDKQCYLSVGDSPRNGPQKLDDEKSFQEMDSSYPSRYEATCGDYDNPTPHSRPITSPASAPENHAALLDPRLNSTSESVLDDGPCSSKLQVSSSLAVHTNPTTMTASLDPTSPSKPGKKRSAQSLAELRRKAFLSMPRRPVPVKTTTSSYPQDIPSHTECEGPVDVKTEDMIPSQSAQDSLKTSHWNEHYNKSTRSSCTEILCFELNESDYEDERPYNSFFSVTPSPPVPLSVEEQIEDMRIRVVRLGKCPSLLSSQPERKRRKTIATISADKEKAALVRTESLLPNDSDIQCNNTILIPNNSNHTTSGHSGVKGSLDLTRSLDDIDMCGEMKISRDHEKAMELKVKQNKTFSTNCDENIETPGAATNFLRDTEGSGSVKLPMHNGNYGGSVRSVERVDLSHSSLVPGRNIEAASNETSNKRGLEKGIRESQSMRSEPAASHDGKNCSLVRFKESALNDIEKSSKRIHRSDENQQRDVGLKRIAGNEKSGMKIQNSSQMRELKLRIDALEKYRLKALKSDKSKSKLDTSSSLEKQTPLNVSTTMRADSTAFIENEIAQNRALSNGKTTRYYGEADAKIFSDHNTRIGDGIDNESENLIVGQWNVKEKNRETGLVEDAAEMGEINDLKLELEMSRKQLSTIQGYSEIMQSTNASVAQVAAKLSFRRVRMESMEEELKRAQLEVREAELEYKQVIQAAQKVKASLSEIAGNVFEFEELEVGGIGVNDVDTKRQTSRKKVTSKSEKDEKFASPSQSVQETKDSELLLTDSDCTDLNSWKGDDYVLRPSPFSLSSGNFTSCLSVLRAYALSNSVLVCDF